MIDNIKMFKELLNLSAYNTLSYILDDVKNVNYEQVLYDNELDTVYGSEPININASKNIEEEYINMYANEFSDFFKDIRCRNEYEIIDYSIDKEDDIIYKNDLYNNRQKNIINMKKYFLSNINHFKRFKGTKDYTMYIINLYLDLKYKQQYELTATELGTAHNLVIGNRYRILKTTKNYFGDGKVIGNIITADKSLLVDIINNQVALITSVCTTHRSSIKLSINKRYEIISCNDNFFFLGCVAGNIVTNSNLLLPNTDHNNIVVELPSTIIYKLKETVYSIQSILKESTWNNIIKPLVHPIGWIVYFTNLSTSMSDNTFIQTKNIQIKDTTKLMNLGNIHNNPILNNCSHYTNVELANLNLLDTIKLNSNIGYKRGFLDYSLISCNVNDLSDVRLDTFIKLIFNDNIETDIYGNINLVIQGTTAELDYSYVVENNILTIKPKLDLIVNNNYVLTVKKELLNIYGKELNNDILIKFNTYGIMINFEHEAC